MLKLDRKVKPHKKQAVKKGEKMKRTIKEVLEELQTDFRDLQAYIDEDSEESWDLNDGVLRGILKTLINDYMIPELKELSELLEMEE